MQLLLSGYGEATGLYDCEEKKFIWRSDTPTLSYLHPDRATGIFFGALEQGTGSELFKFTQDKSGGFQLTHHALLKGDGLCHIAYAPQQGLLAGSCYGSGDIFFVRAGDDFGAPVYESRQGGQTAGVSRVHSVLFSLDERYAYSANIALDRIYVYALQNSSVEEAAYIALPKGVGPRHMLIVENDLYVITEYSNQIFRLKLSVPAQPEPIDVISTLPESFSKGQGKSYGSTLCFNKENGLLYAGNRGANNIAVFKRASDGSLSPVSHEDCGGVWPRHIALCGDFLAAANEHSGYAALLSKGKPMLKIPFKGVSFVCPWGES